MKTKATKIFFQVLISAVIVWGVITIFKAGYAFGGWLFAMLH